MFFSLVCFFIAQGWFLWVRRTRLVFWLGIKLVQHVCTFCTEGHCRPSRPTRFSDYRFFPFCRTVEGHTAEVVCQIARQKWKMPNFFLWYLLIHIRLSHFFFFSHVNDLLSWQVYLSNKKKNIQIIHYNINFFKKKINFKINFISEKKIFSKTNLFFNLFWLERELREMTNINITNQLDKRNLLLNYGFTNAPLLKSLPSWGEEELYYSNIDETCIFKKITLQI